MGYGLFIGDGDEVDFVEDVEERFGVSFDATDYLGWIAIGDVHASLMKRIGDIEAPGGMCASQMAFYRLRRAAGSANSGARPDTRLDQLGLGSPKKTMLALQGCGLKVPSADFGVLGTWALLAVFLAVVALAIAFLARHGATAAWATAVLCLGVTIMKLEPQHYPEDAETLGALATTVAHRNPMMLKAHGAGLRPGDLWLSVRALAAEHTGLAEVEIHPETPIIQQSMKSYAARA